MEREMPRPGEFYRHFKNKTYEILTVATHSETGEKLVVYRALYGTYQDYVRPLAMFLSEVDHEKYPDVRQKYRFERIGDRVSGMPEEEKREKAAAPSPTDINIEETDSDETNEEGQELLMEFLDLETFAEKREFLRLHSKEVTDKFIDDVGTVMDLTIKKGETEDRLRELISCLSTMSRYDGRRLRDR